jgi:chromosome segregation ATPase
MGSASERLDEIHALFEQSSAMFGPVLADYEINLEDLRAQANASRSKNDLLSVQQRDIRAELATVLTERDRILRDFHTCQQQLAEVTDLLTDSTRRLDQAESQVAKAHLEKEKLENFFAARISELAAIVDERERLLGELQAREQALFKTEACQTELADGTEKAEVPLSGVDKMIDSGQ